MAITKKTTRAKKFDTSSRTIEEVLVDRGAKYGEFYEHARIAQAIKRAMVDSPNWDRLTPAMKEALEMDAHKTARILNGDPNFYDSWFDKIGYIKLVADTLEATNVS